MSKETVPFTQGIREYMNAWFNVTHLKPGVLGYNKWTVNWWKGTEKGHENKSPMGSQPKTIPKKVLDMMHSYIHSNSEREKVPAEHYRHGIKYEPMNDGNRDCMKAYLYFLRRFHAEETGQISELERRLYAPSPRAVALKDEDRILREQQKKQRAEERKNRKPWETEVVRNLEEKIVTAKTSVEEFYLSLAYASKMFEFPEAPSSCKCAKEMHDAIGTFAFCLADFIETDLERKINKRSLGDTCIIDSSSDVGLITHVILDEMSDYTENGRFVRYLNSMIEYLKTKKLDNHRNTTQLTEFLKLFNKSFRLKYMLNIKLGKPYYLPDEDGDENEDGENSGLFENRTALIRAGEQ